MTRSSHLLFRSMTGAALLGLAIASTGHAASSDSGATLDEIVVTAQFRETKLQDTPLSITAVTGDMLEARSQLDISQVAAQAPNVVLTPGNSAFGGPTAQVYIRGIGQADSSFAYEPGVGMYVDDVYYATTFGSLFDLLDLDRVEILRGPQGTLAGKNSIGGAVRLYSKKPSADAAAFIEGTYGSYQRMDFRGGSNFTLVDGKLFARISGLSRQSDGYQDRLDYACANGGSPSARINSSCKIGTAGGKDIKALRAALRWIASDAVEANLVLDVTRDTSESPASTLLAAPPAGGYLFANGTPFDNRYATPNNPYVNYATFCGNGGGTYPAPGPPGTPPIVVPTRTPFCVPNHNDFRDYGASGTIDWKLSDTLSLRSISAYRGYSGGFGDDADNSPFDFQTNWNYFTHHQFSQEVRLSGQSFGTKLDWTTGLYYFNGQSSIGGRIHFPGQGLDFLPNDPVYNVNKSAFLHVDVHPVAKLDVDAGVRYTDDSKKYVFSRTDANTGGVPPSLTAINGLVASFSGTRWDYNLGAAYHITSDVMGYLRWSTGFRGGGINARPLFGNQNGSFAPETLNAYELGLKTEWLDHRLRANVSAFFDKYNNIVITESSPYFNPNLPVNTNPASPLYNPPGGTFPASVPINGGKGDLKGAELEVLFEPIKGLSLDATVSTLSFKYTELSSAAIASGLTLNSPRLFMPKTKWSAGVQYSIDTGGGSTITPRIDVSHQDDFQTRDTGLVQPYKTFNTVPAYTLTNARLTWRPASKTWEASLSVTNLFDKLYWYNTFDLQYLNSVAVGQPAPPREYAITIKRQF